MIKFDNSYSVNKGISYQNTAKNTRGNTLFSKVMEEQVEKSSKRDEYVKECSLDIYNAGIYTKEKISSSLELPMETERYIVESCSEVYGEPAYAVSDKKTGNITFVTENQMAVQKDSKTGLEFLINMEQPFSYCLNMTTELKNILNDIADKRGFKIETIPMQGGLSIQQDLKTGLQYLTIDGKEGWGARIIIKSDEDKKIIDKLTEEFMQYPVCEDQSIANLYALLEITGNLKRGNDGFAFLTPSGIDYIPYDGDPKKAWEIDMSEGLYRVARNALAEGNFDIENGNEWMKILKKANITNGRLELWDYFYNMTHQGSGYWYQNDFFSTV